MFSAVACLSFAILGVHPAHADKRAFVAAVNSYANVGSLETAIADGTGMAKKLEEIGFTVAFHKNISLKEFNSAWSEFLNAISAGDDVVFYFAGHGVQVDTLNYLLPRDIPGPSSGREAFLEKSVNFHQVLEDIQSRQPRAAVYILDACRNDPFRDKGKGKAKGTLGQTKGLARIENVYNAFVMYSAGPDEYASDKPVADRENTLYIHNLMPLIAQRDSSLVDIAKRIQVIVAGETKEVQKPAYFDGILGQYYLAKPNDGTFASADNITNDNVVRLGGFATWDQSCQSRPAPRVSVTSAPKHGRIMLRYEKITAAGKHFGNACDKSKQRGIAVYYLVDEANRESTKVDRVQLSVKHWSVAPVTSADETFEIDLATRYSRRVTAK